jgi:MFS family permease
MTLAHDSVALVILWSSVMFAGVGAAFASIPNLIVAAVGAHETGEATGTNAVVRNIGSAVGAQIAGTVIAGHVLANGLPTNEGFTIAFLIGTAGAVIAAVSVLFIPGRVSEASARTQPDPVAGTI